MNSEQQSKSNPLEQHMKYMLVFNENAKLKIEIKLLNERLKKEEDKNRAR